MRADGIPRRLIYGFVLVSIASSASSVIAQNIKATLGGKVLDPQGSVIPGVVLTVRDLERGHIRQVTSNDKGMFLQLGLEPGVYKIEATQAGFARYESGALPLKVGDFLNVEVHFSIAWVASTVEVLGHASTVSADHPHQFKSFNSDEMNDLPVFAGGQGRNFYAQALTTAGVTLSTLAHRPFAVSGQRPRNNNYLIDSAEMNDANSGFIAGRAETEQLISQEAVQSFQIITHNFKAEYGRNSGSIVNLVSKSGSNQLRGSVYEYHNNSALSARNPFETPATKTSQRSNLAGFTAGGPIRKDAIHLFGNYEFFRTRGAALRNYQTLTEDERARAVPAVRPLVALYPISPSGSRIVTRGVPSTGDQNTYLIRGDIVLSQRQTLMIRTNYTDSQRDIDGIGNTVSSHVNIHNQTRSAAVHHSFSAGPNGLNELRFNYTRQTEEDDFLDPVFLGDPTVNGEVGFVIVPGLSLAGPLGFLGRENIQNTYRASDDLTLVRGRHVLKFGTSASRVQVNGGTVNNGFRGTLFFPNIAAFLASQPLSYNRNTGNPLIGLRRTEWHAYIQDDWKIKPGLTINLGLRYELNTSPTEVAGRISERFRFRGDGNNFGPRVGFAWSPRSGTAVRGGYGVFYNAIEMVFLGLTRFNPPLVVNVSAFRPTLPNQLAESTAGIPSGLVIPEPNTRTPYAQHLTLAVDQELWSPRSSLTVAYVGTPGTKLSRTRRPNGGDNLPQAQRPDPTLGIVSRLETSAASNYHGLQLSLSQSFAARLDLRASYTYSKFIDEVSEIISTNQVPERNVVPLDENDLRRDRAPSDFDIPQIFTVSYLYRFPFWQQNRWLGGWTVSGITTLQSGRPFTLYSGSDNLAGTNNNRLLDVAGALIRSGSSATPVRLSPGFSAAQVTPRTGELGSLGRNSERGDGMIVWNLSVAKVFQVTGDRKFELRAEILNLWNTTNFNEVDPVLASPNFGRVLSAFEPRRVQLAARFVF